MVRALGRQCTRTDEPTPARMYAHMLVGSLVRFRCGGIVFRTRCPGLLWLRTCVRACTCVGLYGRTRARTSVHRRRYVRTNTRTCERTYAHMYGHASVRTHIRNIAVCQCVHLCFRGHAFLRASMPTVPCRTEGGVDIRTRDNMQVHACIRLSASLPRLWGRRRLEVR
jgi:hypothetical protein